MSELDDLFDRKPSVEVAGESVRVLIPAGLGDVEFMFSDVVCKSQKFDADLAVTRPKPSEPLLASQWERERDEPPFSFHISAASLSNVEAYRRALQNYYGKDLDWDRLLPKACKLAEAAYKATSIVVDPDDVELTNGMEFTVEDIAPKGQVSCLFGMGESAKSLVAQTMIQDSAAGTSWLSRLTLPMNWLWLDYENPKADAFAMRRNRLVVDHPVPPPAGSIKWMPGRGVPLPDQLATIQREMRMLRATGLVVDSAAFACGGNAIEQEVATRFFNALNRLDATVLLIAHVTKDDAADQFPFGSVFWHNGIHGRSWYMRRSKDSIEDEIEVGMYSRKVSDGRRPKDFAIRFKFSGDTGPITYDQSDMTQRGDLVERSSGKNKVLAAVNGRMTYEDIAKETKLTVNGVKSTIQRHLGGVLQVTYEGGKAWVSKRSFHSDEDSR